MFIFSVNVNSIYGLLVAMYSVSIELVTSTTSEYAIALPLLSLASYMTKYMSFCVGEPAKFPHSILTFETGFYIRAVFETGPVDFALLRLNEKPCITLSHVNIAS